MTSSPSQLWALIAAHQSATGISTNELARRIGVSRQTLADWRTSGLVGRVPKRSTLTGVADANTTASSYYSPIMFLFIGGAFMALAIERTGLHRRLALFIMGLSGGKTW